MMWDPPPEHPLRRLFAGYTEFAFLQTFGMADPPLVDYLSGLLSRFLHADVIHRLKNATGKPLDQVAEMVAEVAALPHGRTAREVHRHIGDFTLFWTGMYPEALHRLRATPRIDFFVDYCRQGKRSYLLASQFDDDLYHDESAVLRRISDQFEMCAFGLTKVRQEWERDSIDGGKIIGATS
jgi:hypothetical protein